MAKKLVLDREISINLNGGQSLSVPKGEVWRGTFYSGSSSINKNNEAIIGGGTTIGPPTGAATLYFTGIAFKIVDA